jgi:hypothetical protein
MAFGAARTPKALAKWTGKSSTPIHGVGVSDWLATSPAYGIRAERINGSFGE